VDGVTSASVIQILLAGLGGGLGALVAWGLLRFLPRSWTLMLTIACGVTGSQLLPNMAEPWLRGREVDASLATDPLLSVMVADYPEMKSSIRDSFVRADGNADAVRRDVLGVMVKKYVGRAPGEPVLALGQATIGALRSLESDADACYRFLFPGSGPTVRLADGPRDALYAATLRVVEAGHGLQPVAPADVANALDIASTSLVEKHGDDAAVLQNATAAGVDRGLVCRMSIAFYEEIMALPREDAVRVWRDAFGERQPSGAQGP